LHTSSFVCAAGGRIATDGMKYWIELKIVRTIVDLRHVV
jgi:hypothetical protein